MIASTQPASAAASIIWARSRWWVEKPTNLALPDFRIASAASLNSLLLTKFDRVVEAVRRRPGRG